MHTYEFTFKCKRCAKQITELVTSPDVLTREELAQMEFLITCPNAACGWRAAQNGAEAEQIEAAIKPVSICE